jgi:WD40 repeat protein/serine/threonine protein kinase
MASIQSRSEVVVSLAEEFLDRYRRGERPALKEYIDNHPDLEADIREAFPAMAMLENIALAEESLAASFAGGEGPDVLRQLGDFRIIREVGRGGMGVVYEAEQISLGRHVALKALPRKKLLDPKQRRRFEREAKAAARLHHTNIVPVFGVGEQDGLPFYIMQFIQGLGLDEVVAEVRRIRTGEEGSAKPNPSVAAIARSLVTGSFEPAGNLMDTDERGPPGREESDLARVSGTGSGSSLSLPGQTGFARHNRSGRKATYWQSVAQIGVQVAEALEYAHRQGVLHRDIKPSNLLLDRRGTVWVTDFGLAKADDADNLTQTGDILGTLRYMPPESFAGKGDARSDVYALGLTLYELLALRPAFRDKDRNQLIKQVTDVDPPPLGRVNPAIPRDLRTIVHKAIEKDPSHRYTAAAALAEDLHRFVADEPIRARRVSGIERAWRWCRRNPAAAGLFFVSFIAGLAFVALGVGLHYGGRLQESNAHLQSALGEAEAQKALRHVALAYNGWQNGSMGDVEELLEGVPPARRRWEWHHLHRLCHADFKTVPGRPGHVAYSKDGTRLVAPGRDGTVNLLDASTGLVVRWVRGDGAPLAISRDGTRIATQIGDRHNSALQSVQPTTILLWDAQTGEQIAERVDDLNPSIASMAFSPDGKVLAAAGFRGEVKLWDTSRLNDRSSEPRILPHSGILSGVAFSPDGRRLAASSRDGPVIVWEVESGQTVTRLLGHSGGTKDVAFSPDGTVIATAGSDRAVRIWDAASGRELRQLLGHTEAVHGVAFRPDGACVASAGLDQTIRVWDAQTGSELYTLRGHGGVVSGVAYSPDGSRLASASIDGTVKIWAAMASPEVRVVQGHSLPVFGLAFSPDSTRLVSTAGAYLSSGPPGEARVWDVFTGQVIRTFPGHPGGVLCAAFDPDGQSVASAGGTWDDAKRTYVSGDAQLWDAATGKVRQTFMRHTDAIWSVAFNHGGTLLATASRDSTINLWVVKTGEFFATLPGHASVVKKVAFSPDGKQMASGGKDGEAWIWDLATREKVYSFPSGTRALEDLAYSRDGTRLATANVDGQITVRDATAGHAEVMTLWHNTLAGLGHGGLWALAFSPDGTRLASAGVDGRVILWDLATGQSILSLRGHAGDLRSVAFSPDGAWLAAGGVDGSVQIWDGRPRP